MQKSTNYAANIPNAARVSNGIMRQLLLWVHHDNNGIFIRNDIQLNFSPLRN